MIGLNGPSTPCAFGLLQGDPERRPAAPILIITAKHVAPGGFSVLAGSAATFHGALEAGASGGILALGCILPDACVRLYELTRAGRHDEARTLQQQLVPLTQLIGSAYGVPGVKAALNLLGFDVGYPRPPLIPLTGPTVAALREALHAVQEIPA